MNQEDILSGKAGLASIQQVLLGQSSRRFLRSEVQKMLRPGYRVGPLHLTRAKFKPDRKLSAYFTFPALDANGGASHFVQLAVSWQKNLEEDNSDGSRGQLQEEANRSGLMPVQCELWRENPERGIKLQIWPLDPAFPHLIRLGNPNSVSQIFVSLGIAGDEKQMPAVTPIRYRPGERHVLRYELESSESSSGPKKRLYAKLYKNAQDAARAYGIANRVVDWLDANHLGLQGNRPLAMREEDCVLFYPHVSGIPLSHQFHRSRKWLFAQLQVVGRALAVLHSGSETLQADLKQNTFTNEVKVVRRASEHIQVLLPDVHAKIFDLLGRAQDRYLNLPQEKVTFTHSDFKSDHLLSTAEGMTLIDFDTCTLTDPAMDIGKFLADLEWWFTLEGLAGLEKAQAELLQGYLTGAGTSQVLDERMARARLYYVLILIKIVVRRVPLYDKEWAAITARMIERAGQLFPNQQNQTPNLG